MISAYFSFFSALATISIILFAFRKNIRVLFFHAKLYSILFITFCALGYFEVLADFSTFPPPFLAVFPSLLILVTLLVCLSPGKNVLNNVGIKVIIGLSIVRFLPETLLYLSYLDGIVPIQMTLEGRNLDIITAILSIVLFLIWDKVNRPKLLTALHTIVGAGLLINVLITALLSGSTPFRVFFNEPTTDLVPTFPYILLPGIHVFTAFYLHGLAIRYLFTCDSCKKN